MPTEFKLPNLGENIESGDVVNVLVKEGDSIKANQGVIEIETDKAVIEVPSTQAGRVSKVHVKQGQTIKVGSTVLTLEAAAGAAKGEAKAPSKPAASNSTDAAAPAKAPAAQKPAAKPTTAAQPTPKAAAKSAPTDRPSPKPAAREEGNGRSTAPPKSEPARAEPAPAAATATAKAADTTTPPPAGPEVRRLARELGVDLARVNGSGSGGRITREDVIAAVRKANLSGSTLGPRDEPEHDNYGPIEREKLSRIRRTIAANMVNSVQTIPQLTNFDDADITELEQWRKDSSADYEKEQIKLTSMAFVMKAVALALKEHRTVNASLDIENEQIIYKHYVNIGVAVDTERGLIVPVVRDVDRLSIKEIAKSLGELAQKARSGQTAIEEMRGASFSISNLGAIGGVYSTPIINPPEVGILLVGRARKLPVVVDGDRIEPRLMMPLSLTYDHRLVDGAAAARFLNEVIDYLESPRRLLLA
jgi:pyruvate dehydrogenase E2 component (dihydrolipoamide acetyltransferase)